MLQKHLPSSASNLCPYVNIYGPPNSFAQIKRKTEFSQSNIYKAIEPLTHPLTRGCQNSHAKCCYTLHYNANLQWSAYTEDNWMLTD